MKAKAKNILLVSTEFPPQPGGIGNHALNLAKSLQDSGYAISVITDHRSFNIKTALDFDAKLNFFVHRVKRKRFRGFMYIKRLLLLFQYIKSADVVIASGKFSLWIVAFSSLWYRKKFLAVVHGSEVNISHKFFNKLTAKSLKRFEKLIAVSNFTKKLVCKINSNVVVIPNGFDPDKWKHIKTEKEGLKGSPKLITVGNVTERKGQLNVIKQLPALLKVYPDLHYYCIGLPTQKEEFMAVAKSLKVANHVHFLGNVSNAKLKYCLLASDVFVMLSSETKTGDVEGFGIAILEANSLGIPSIGAKNCGIEDAVNVDKSGVLITVNQTQEFIDAINKIQSNYASYSADAKEWAAMHNWQIIIKKYIKEIN
ncbi:MAG: glycosyltransferase family 4 protein [Oceanihabitans sp.]